ncbi:hypothetical protein BCEP4_110007 [Burkholderia cepacia]|nr:hypothetical protein BCEP4_110007 [Burkholderia cepacia]
MRDSPGRRITRSVPSRSAPSTFSGLSCSEKKSALSNDDAARSWNTFSTIGAGLRFGSGLTSGATSTVIAYGTAAACSVAPHPGNSITHPHTMKLLDRHCIFHPRHPIAVRRFSTAKPDDPIEKGTIN